MNGSCIKYTPRNCVKQFLGRLFLQTLLQFPLLLLNTFLLQQQLGLALQGLLVIDNLLLQLLNGFGIAMHYEDTIKMSEVQSCGFTLHPQVAVAEVIIGGGLQLVGSHDEDPATDHNQAANQ